MKLSTVQCRRRKFKQYWGFPDGKASFSLNVAFWWPSCYSSVRGSVIYVIVSTHVAVCTPSHNVQCLSIPVSVCNVPLSITLPFPLPSTASSLAIFFFRYSKLEWGPGFSALSESSVSDDTASSCAGQSKEEMQWRVQCAFTAGWVDLRKGRRECEKWGFAAQHRGDELSRRFLLILYNLYCICIV